MKTLGLSYCEVDFLIDVLEQYLTVLNQAMDYGLSSPEEFKDRGKKLYEMSSKEFDKALKLYKKLSGLLADA